jgi:hypothetical protein
MTKQVADLTPALPQAVNKVIVKEFGYAPEEDGQWEEATEQNRCRAPKLKLMSCFLV